MDDKNEQAKLDYIYGSFLARQLKEQAKEENEEPSSDIMPPSEFHKKMLALITGDPEITHADASALMCELLKELGYDAGVEVFEAMTKWYA